MKCLNDYFKSPKYITDFKKLQVGDIIYLPYSAWKNFTNQSDIRKFWEIDFREGRYQYDQDALEKNFQYERKIHAISPYLQQGKYYLVVGTMKEMMSKKNSGIFNNLADLIKIKADKKENKYIKLVELVGAQSVNDAEMRHVVHSVMMTNNDPADYVGTYYFHVHNRGVKSDEFKDMKEYKKYLKIFQDRFHKRKLAKDDWLTMVNLLNPHYKWETGNPLKPSLFEQQRKWTDMNQERILGLASLLRPIAGPERSSFHYRDVSLDARSGLRTVANEDASARKSYEHKLVMEKLGEENMNNDSIFFACLLKWMDLTESRHQPDLDTNFLVFDEELFNIAINKGQCKAARTSYVRDIFEEYIQLIIERIILHQSKILDDIEFIEREIRYVKNHIKTKSHIWDVIRSKKCLRQSRPSTSPSPSSSN